MTTVTSAKRKYRCSGNKINQLLIFLFICFLATITIFNIQFRRDIQRRVAPVAANARDDQLASEDSSNTIHSEEFETSYEELNIDRRTDPDENTYAQLFDKQMSNYPFAFLSNIMNLGNDIKYNDKCANIPRRFEIDFSNTYWQTLFTSNGTFQLFNAYFDNRRLNSLGPTVRIIAMVNRLHVNVTTYCQVWFEGEKRPFVVETTEYRWMWIKEWGNYIQGLYQPYLLSCVLPPEYNNTPPAAVSLVENQCDNARNILKIVYDKPQQKKDFAVCVKALDFPYRDLSVKLIEWIELIGILGADKIIFYQFDVHSNVSKVLKHYQEKGKIEVVPITLAGGEPNEKPYQHYFLERHVGRQCHYDIIEINDCFYKHMYQYKYVVLLDIDEVIMPTEAFTWKELLETFVIPDAKKERDEERASYFGTAVYFLDDMINKYGFAKDIPKYMHMLQHVYRAKTLNPPGYYIKGFQNTDIGLTLHNHFPFSCLTELNWCVNYEINVTYAKVHHYRYDCPPERMGICNSVYRANVTRDAPILRYKDELISRVNESLKALGFFPERRTGTNMEDVT